MHVAVKLIVAMATVAAVAAGCYHIDKRDKAAAAVAVGNRAKASYAMEQRLKAPLKPRVLVVGEHQVVVLEVPSEAGSVSGSYYGLQKCYVWRDAEYRTATISCPHEEELKLTDE